MAHQPEPFSTRNENIDISYILNGDGGKLIKEYANLDPEELEKHVKHIAHQAWAISKYPCFRHYEFLYSALSHSPLYEQILAQTRAGNLFLDLGCGLGQDIRCLVQDGAPSNLSIWGSSCSNDRSRLGCTFIVQDFFEDTPQLDNLVSRVKVINSSYFMHLFDWDTQLRAAKRMMRLACQEKGTPITGFNFGSHSPRDWDMVPPGLPPQYLHDRRSLARLWGLAARETKTSWSLRSVVEYDEYCSILDPEGFRLRWVAERL
ncbi:hypothetical protein BDV34DRAFT_214537 [Aspergillus parasiticus]|uniref:Methyltransferase domain-containing protein n=1 Tax=Aspergillus parasiticus TaxID=5067 RepID=A0A5N6DEJ9_ASPPA|nr:hypothetical protein BDV34DRAFT_214537 [Aspergillus parasiticus]